MANTINTKYTFDVQGIEKVKEAFKIIGGFADSHKMSAEIDKVSQNIQNLFKKIPIYNSGGLSSSKLGIDGIVSQFSSLVDKIQKDIAKELGKNLESPFKDELEKLEKTIAKELKNSERSSNLFTEGRNNLESKRISKHYGIPIPNNFKNAGPMRERITADELKLSNMKEGPAKDTLSKKLESYRKYLTDLESLLEQEQILLHNQQKTSEKLKEAYIQREEIESKEKSFISQNQNNVPEELKEVIELLDDLKKIRSQVNSNEVLKAEEKMAENIEKTTKEVKELDEANKKADKTFGQKILSGFSYYTIFNKVKQLWTTSVRTVQELDRAMTEAAIVTSMNKKEAWGLLEGYQELADVVGRTTAEIASLSAFFLQQGMNIKNAMEMTRVAAQSAAIAGISLQESADYLTSAINGFGLAASSAEIVADKFAAVGAATAADFEELAIAMSKVSPVAQSAGVSIDFMMGVLAKGIHTTREAPENIGTAFKTIFARMRELTDIGKATEDGMSLNRVEKSLNSIGIQLRDTTGQFRNLEDVIMDLGYGWKNLDSLQQAYLATALAGSRQQPRLMAILNDFETTVEFIEISKDSAGAMEIQHMDYMDSMEAAANKVKNAWEGVITGVVESEVIVGIYSGIAAVVELLGKGIELLVKNWWLLIPVLTAITPLLISQINATASLFIAKMKNLGIAPLELAANTSLIKKIGVKIGLIKAEDVAQKMSNITKIKAIALNAALGLGIGALVVGAVALIAAMIRANRTVSQTANEIKKLNKEIYESNEKTSSLNTLVSEFDKLTDKIYKTNEELERMKELLSDASNFTAGDVTKNFTTTDIFGNQTIDHAAVDQFLREEEIKRINAETKSLKLANDQIFKSFSKSINNPTIEKTLKNFYSKPILGIVENIEDPKSKKNIEEALSKLIDSIDLKDYEKSIYSETPGYQHFEIGKGLESENIASLLKESLEDLVEYEEELRKIEKLEMSGTQEIEKKNEAFLKLNKSVRENLNLNEKEKNTLLKTLENAYQSAFALNKILGMIPGNAEKFTKSFFDNGNTIADLENFALGLGLGRDGNYKDAVENNRKSLEEIEKIEKDREDFIRKRQDKGKKIKESDLKKYDDRIEEFKNSIVEDPELLAIGDVLNNNRSILENYLSGVSEDIDKGFDLFIEKMKEKYPEIENAATIWQKSIERIFKTPEQIVNSISNQGELLSKALEVNSDMQKGDFKSFNEIVENFGLDAFNKFRQTGDSRVLIEEGKKNIIKDTEGVLAHMRNTLKSNPENELLQSEIYQLEAVLDYYESISSEVLVMTANIEKANNQISKMSNISSKLDLMKDFGFKSGDIGFDFFSKLLDKETKSAKELSDNSIAENIRWLNDVTTELESEGLMKNGEILFATEAGGIEKIEKYKTALDGTIEAIETRMKIAEEERKKVDKYYDELSEKTQKSYDSQLESIQKYNEEKWREIEYERTLYDLQMNIISARNKLIGSSLDGSSAASVESNRRELEILRLDRQKEIEDQMIARIEKQLEKEREDRLEKIEEERHQKVKSLMQNTNNSLDDIYKLLDARLFSNTDSKKTLGGSGGSGRAIKELSQYSDVSSLL